LFDLRRAFVCADSPPLLLCYAATGRDLGDAPNDGSSDVQAVTAKDGVTEMSAELSQEPSAPIPVVEVPTMPNKPDRKIPTKKARTVKGVARAAQPSVAVDGASRRR
jgi:hypothetical protein